STPMGWASGVTSSPRAGPTPRRWGPFGLPGGVLPGAGPRGTTAWCSTHGAGPRTRTWWRSERTGSTWGGAIAAPGRHGWRPRRAVPRLRGRRRRPMASGQEGCIEQPTRLGVAGMSHIQRRGKDRWRARYIGPDGRERSKTFTRKVDAERFLATVDADLVRGE